VKLNAMPLSASQRRYLRGLCHDLNAVILLGAKGLGEPQLKELERALDRHELVKIKLSGGDREERQQQIDALIKGTGAELVQKIGHTVSLFRRNDDEPKLALPR
jgi:RNA-binding protein